MTDLVRLTGLPAAAIRLPADTLSVRADHEQFVLLPRNGRRCCARAISALRAFHAQTPDELGPDAARLRRIAAPGIAALRLCGAH